MPWANRLLRSESPKLAHPVRTLAGWAMQKSGRFEHVVIERDGYVLPFLASSNVALTYWAAPDFVDPSEAVIRRMLASGDVFVDVGANVGSLAALAAGLVGPSGRVVAIEPHPATVTDLRRTVTANSLTNVVCLDIACGASAGTARMTDEPRKDDNNRIAGDDRGVSVRVTTIAEILREMDIEHVALLKIDVEGFEEAVIDGLAGEFHRVAAIYLEVIDANLRRYGSSAAGVVGALRANGFSCFRSAIDPTNIVALPKDRQPVMLGDDWTPIPGGIPIS